MVIKFKSIGFRMQYIGNVSVKMDKMLYGQLSCKDQGNSEPQQLYQERYHSILPLLSHGKRGEKKGPWELGGEKEKRLKWNTVVLTNGEWVGTGERSHNETFPFLRFLPRSHPCFQLLLSQLWGELLQPPLFKQRCFGRSPMTLLHTHTHRENH